MGKGASYERQMCRKLSLWLSHGEHEDLLWRSSISGGRATVALKAGRKLSRQAGDISAIAPLGHILTDRFFLELKHYRNLQLEAFFLHGKGKLAKFWKKALAEAKQHKREPLMIVRQNRTADLVITKPGALRDVVHLGKSMSIQVRNSKVTACEIRLLQDVLGNLCLLAQG